MRSLILLKLEILYHGIKYQETEFREAHQVS